MFGAMFGGRFGGRFRAMWPGILIPDIAADHNFETRLCLPLESIHTICCMGIGMIRVALDLAEFGNVDS